MEDLLTTAQAAAIKGVSHGRIKQLVVAGRIPAMKIGRDNLIRRADLDRFQPLPRGRRPGKSKKKTGRRATPSTP